MKPTSARRVERRRKNATVVRRARPARPAGQAGAPRAWIVTADMGLGHQRAAWPLRDVAEGGIMTLGKASNTSPSEHRLWEQVRRSYEFLSRTKSWPIIGNFVFGLLDRMQNIPRFYPVRDMSKPSFQVIWLKRLIARGMCGGMMDAIRGNPLPLVTTFYAPAIAADLAGYTPTYCVICDAEINRAWVAEKPRESRIVYLVPCGRAVRRLNEYGIPDERIWLTGFPLPTECLGDRSLNVLRRDLGQRLHYLDPLNRFWPLHGRNIEYFLGRENCRFLRQRVLSVTFGVGGAGAQVDIAHTVAHSLREKIVQGEIRLSILAGIRPDVKARLEAIRRELAAPQIRIIAGTSLEEYFHEFAQCMKSTDILWTKPSELSFYCGLGIPIIMAPTIGSQEQYNQAWLLEIQAGFPQQDPQYTDEWLLDLVKAARLADAAWDGFLKARKFGTYKIHEIIRTGRMKMESSVLLR